MSSKLLRWLPFTYAVIGLVLMMSWWHGDWANGLLASAREAYGHAPAHTWRGEWGRLLTSIFLTADIYHLMAAVPMTWLCVGWLERQRGWRTAMLVFFSAHCLALLMMSCVLLLTDYSLASRWSRELVLAADIGPSAGYYACLGAVLIANQSASPAKLQPGNTPAAASSNEPARRESVASVVRVVTWLVVLILFGRVLYSWGYASNPTALQADLAHLLACLIGGTWAAVAKN